MRDLSTWLRPTTIAICVLAAAGAAPSGGLVVATEAQELTEPDPASADQAARETATEAVAAYHRSLILGDAAGVRSSLADELVMFNGNFSDDPTDWEAHLYLTGDALDAWPSEIVRFAGPHANEYEFVSTDIRGDAALVVTVETGRNKFRTWEQERVVYLLGRRSGEWKIVGLYVRDVRNPD